MLKLIGFASETAEASEADMGNNHQHKGKGKHEKDGPLGMWTEIDKCLGNANAAMAAAANAAKDKGGNKQRRATDLSGTTITREATTKGGTSVELELVGIRTIGKGSFGTITKMRARRGSRHKSEYVAVKRPEPCDCDKIERDVLIGLQHQNVVDLKYCFMDKGLHNLVLELIDDGNLYDYLHSRGAYDTQSGLGILTEVYSYQLFRGLAYCHAMDVIHRDLKPENLLIDIRRGTLKIADFGCACYLHDKSTQATYVGTRDFRAPELMMDASRYVSKVDIWSAAVILTELILKQPIFYKPDTKTSTDQLYCIFEFLGVPTIEDAEAMHVRMQDWRRPIQSRNFHDTFVNSPVRDLDEFLHLIQRMLLYRPRDRYTAWQVCAHGFFNVLKDPRTRLPGGNPLPPLFNFTREELLTMPKSVLNFFEVEECKRDFHELEDDTPLELYSYI